MWSVSEWTAWSSHYASQWSAALATAWDEAIASARGLVEGSDPVVLQRRATDAWDALWGAQGAYALLAAYDTAVREADEPTRLRMIAEAASAAGISPDEAHPDAFTARLDAYAAGVIKDATYQDGGAPVVGIAPIVIGAIVLGIGGLCWLWSRSGDIANERSRLSLVARFGESDPKAALVAVTPPNPGSSGSWTPLLLGGLAVAGLVVGGAMWARR